MKLCRCILKQQAVNLADIWKLFSNREHNRFTLFTEYTLHQNFRVNFQFWIFTWIIYKIVTMFTLLLLSGIFASMIFEVFALLHETHDNVIQSAEKFLRACRAVRMLFFWLVAPNCSYTVLILENFTASSLYSLCVLLGSWIALIKHQPLFWHSLYFVQRVMEFNDLTLGWKILMQMERKLFQTILGDSSEGEAPRTEASRRVFFLFVKTHRYKLCL